MCASRCRRPPSPPAQKRTTQQYVTTNPEDTFAIFKVYSGVTSGLSGIVYVQLPESMVSETALKVL